MPPSSAVANALSVDVEDYYQVHAFAGVVDRDAWATYPDRVDANTRRILDLFGRAGVRATFFVLGCVARRHPALVRAIADAGHEVASHGYAHYRVDQQTPRAFARDVTATRKRLEDIAGLPVTGYRAASFSIDRTTWWAFDALAAAGYRYSSSLHPIRHDHYGAPDAPRFPFDVSGLVEIPVGTVELAGRRFSCAGGGFFRVLPYRWTRWAIGRVNRREARPVTFYLHPWEIDPDQPRIAAPPRSRWRHYTGLATMEAKLGRLLADFAWDRIDAVYRDRLEPGVSRRGAP